MSSRVVLALLLGACQVPRSGAPGFGGTPELSSTGTESNSGKSADPTTSAVENSTNADDTLAVILDVSNSADVADTTPAGCQGKIDFLFVISRDEPMDQLQERLIKAFPQFVATIQGKFDDFDYHIMVVDGDEGWGLSTCEPQCYDSETCDEVKEYPCGELGVVTQCDQMIGAGNVFSAGAYAYNVPCKIAGGRRFLTSDQPDLTEAFKCIAQIGVSGRGRLGEALAAAVSTQLAGIGGCNDRFLRDDALLMVTLIGGWDSEGSFNDSSGSPAEWAKAVLDAKNGDPESVVILDIGDPSRPWQDRVWQMTDMFPRALITQKYDLDYGPAFDAATGLVEDACAGFVPPT